jgi:hypothetical protein
MRIKRILARTLALLMVAVVPGIALYGCSGEKRTAEALFLRI